MKNDIRTFDNIQNIGNGQGDDFINCSLLDYPYFKKYEKLNAIDLNKEQALDPDPKAIHQINITENLNQTGNTTTAFHY